MGRPHKMRSLMIIAALVASSIAIANAEVYFEEDFSGTGRIAGLNPKPRQI